MKRIIVVVAILLIAVTASARAQSPLWGEQKNAIVPWFSIRGPGITIAPTRHYMPMGVDFSFGLRPLNNVFEIGLSFSLNNYPTENTVTHEINFSTEKTTSFYIGYQTDWINPKNRNNPSPQYKLFIQLHYNIKYNVFGVQNNQFLRVGMADEVFFLIPYMDVFFNTPKPPPQNILQPFTDMVIRVGLSMVMI